MRSFLLAFAAYLLSGGAFAASFEEDFAVIFIDQATEAKLGDFPLNRTLVARAVRQAADQHAKAVVLKFFFDQPRDDAGDRALASSLTDLPVLLQAKIDDAEAHPNPLPDRFTFPGAPPANGVAGQRGWIPLPLFATNASGVGFVDLAHAKIPLLETYQNRLVKSLAVCCIEQATGKRGEIGEKRRLKFGGVGIKMDTRYCVRVNMPASDDLAYIPFHQFLAGETPADRVRGKVVIIGYDGSKIQTLPSAIGPLRAHRYFVYSLRSIYEQLGQ